MHLASLASSAPGTWETCYLFLPLYYITDLDSVCAAACATGRSNHFEIRIFNYCRVNVVHVSRCYIVDALVEAINIDHIT